MEQVGFVRKVVKDRAELEVRRASGCGSCKGCSAGCETKTHVITLKNDLNVKVGDLVELEGEPKSILKYTFIVYMIPFIFLMVGIFASSGYFKAHGNPNYEILSFLVGIVALFISFFVVKSLDKKIAENDEGAIKMTRIL